MNQIKKEIKRNKINNNKMTSNKENIIMYVAKPMNAVLLIGFALVFLFALIPQKDFLVMGASSIMILLGLSLGYLMQKNKESRTSYIIALLIFLVMLNPFMGILIKNFFLGNLAKVYAVSLYHYFLLFFFPTSLILVLSIFFTKK